MAPWASADEVGTRLKRTLDDDEVAQVELVIEGVTGLVAAAVDKSDDWAADLDPVPAALRMLVIEKAVQVATNPSALSSVTESLGAYSHTDRYREGDAPALAGIFLTDDEERAARRAVYGKNSATARQRSIVDDSVETFRDDSLPRFG